MSRFYEVDRLNKETPEAYDDRTWRERMHYDENGQIFINPMGFKWCISDAASLLGLKVKGKGVATFAKYVKSGILVTHGMPLNIHKDKIPGERLFVPANGKHGSGTRVWRTFPKISPWEGTVIYQIINRIITPDVFEEHLREAGKFVGLGRFRPQMGGYYGRFDVVKIDYVDEDKQ